MGSCTGISYAFDIAFIPRLGGGGGRDVAVLVSRSQMFLPRKLISCRAKLDSALDGSFNGVDSSHTPTVHDIENFPHVPDNGGLVSATPQSERSDSKKLRAVLRVSVPGPSGTLPPHILYLLELGFDLEQIKVIARRYPPFANHSLEGKVKPLIEFLLDLGITKSDLPSVLLKCPRLCGLVLPKKIIPALAFLETIGVDKSKWPKLICRGPRVLTTSREKVTAIVGFLNEMGVSGKNIGKILISNPQILCHSVDDKLRPIAEYFQSLGADTTVVLRHCPQVMNLCLETNLKPVTEFFLANGFSIEDVGTMITKFGALYSYSLKGNVLPKWEFFLKMDYPREHIVKFPQYFGYSLEKRIIPRYYQMKESGVKLSLSLMLSFDHPTFEKFLRKKIEIL